jgi:hypothetical protein
VWVWWIFGQNRILKNASGVDLAANPSIVLPNDGGLDLLFAQPISGNLGTNHGEANNSACFFVWFQHKIQMVKKRKAI